MRGLGSFLHRQHARERRAVVISFVLPTFSPPRSWRRARGFLLELPKAHHGCATLSAGRRHFLHVSNKCPVLRGCATSGAKEKGRALSETGVQAPRSAAAAINKLRTVRHTFKHFCRACVGQRGRDNACSGLVRTFNDAITHSDI